MKFHLNDFVLETFIPRGIDCHGFSCREQCLQSMLKDRTIGRLRFKECWEEKSFVKNEKFSSSLCQQTQQVANVSLRFPFESINLEWRLFATLYGSHFQMKLVDNKLAWLTHASWLKFIIPCNAYLLVCCFGLIRYSQQLSQRIHFHCSWRASSFPFASKSATSRFVAAT